MSDDKVQEILLYEVRLLRKDLEKLRIEMGKMNVKFTVRMTLLGLAGGAVPISAVKLFSLFNN